MVQPQPGFVPVVPLGLLMPLILNIPVLDLMAIPFHPLSFSVFTHEESDLHFVTFVLVLQADPN